MLTRYPELHGQVTLLQVVVPSREDIPKYHELKREIERMVSEINGRFTEPGLGADPLHLSPHRPHSTCWPITARRTSRW